MKKTVLIFLFLCLVLAGCASPSSVAYRNDIPAAEIADTAAAALAGSFREADSDYLSDYVELPAGLSDLTVRIATAGDRIDEYGILHTDTASAEGVRQLLLSYLAQSYERNRAFYDSYIPEETSKLRDAQVRVYGDYVVYAILSPAERNLFFRAVEERLQNTASGSSV